MKKRTRVAVGSLVALLLAVAAIVATPRSTQALVQDPGPVFLAKYCNVPDSDRALLRYYRDSCDSLAVDKLGYKHGVVRPQNDNDLNDPGIVGIVCEIGKEGTTTHLCFGVGAPQ